MRNNYFEDDIVESLEDGKKYYITEKIPKEMNDFVFGDDYIFLISNNIHNYKGVIPYLKIRVRLYKRPIKNLIKWIFYTKKIMNHDI